MKHLYLYALAFVVLGAALGAGIIYATRDISQTTGDSMAGMDHSSMNASSENTETMMGQLEGKSGDEFDKAFLSLMIEHHEGAVDMANAAKQSAKHAEIKAMADDIMSAQNREIEQMKLWQEQWGY